MIQQLKCENPSLDVEEDTLSTGTSDKSLPRALNGCDQSQDQKENEDFTDLGI